MKALPYMPIATIMLTAMCMDGQKEWTASELAEIFADRTSLHGVKSIHNAPNWLVRSFWTLAFLALISSCIWQITMAIIVYFEFRTFTDSQYKWEDKLEFPAITFCNYNRFNRERLVNAASDYDLDPDALWRYLISALQPRKTYPHNASEEALENATMANVAATFTANNLTEQGMIVELSQRWEELFPDSDSTCPEQARSCEEIRKRHNYVDLLTEYGRCFTFNREQQLNATHYDKSLSFLLNINQENYSEIPQSWVPANYQAGVLMIFHNKDELVQIESGVPLSPGQQHLIALSVTEYIKMGGRYDDCGETALTYVGGPYSKEKCVKDQRARATAEQCDCIPLSFAIQSEIDDCSTQAMLKCAGEKMCNEDLLNLMECPGSCRRKKYHPRLDSVQMPNRAVQDSITQQYGSSVGDMRQSMVFVTVTFPDLYQNTFESKPYKQFFDVLADVGGQMGLAVGASFLTLTETLVFLGSSALYALQRKIKSSNPQQSAKVEQKAEVRVTRF